MAEPRVVGLGLCVLDELLVVADLALAKERTRSLERVVGPGGTVSTAVAQAAQLGCRAELLSLVGHDADGRSLLRALRELGVGTRRVVRDSGSATTVALVLVDSRTGERRFVVPDRRALERRAPDFDLSPIRRGSVLLIDGHFPGQAARAVRRAREVGVPIVADFNRPRSDWMRLLPGVDFPIVPAGFGEGWGTDARETLRRLKERSGGTPVVTEGRRGALALLGRRFVRIPAPRVRVRDTTGAGDAFHGAFAAGVARGLSVPDALALAARAGAASCTRLGGTAGLLREPSPPGAKVGA